MTETITPVATEETTTTATPEKKQDFAQVVQHQIADLKQELSKRVETLKSQFPLTQTDLIELKETLKVEFTAILDDVTKVSKDIKHDLSEITIKHKEQISETLKSSKEHVVEALSKINLAQVKEKAPQTPEQE